MFTAGSGYRFETPQRSKSQCSKLVVDGEVISDPESLLGVWADHFPGLCKSRGDGLPHKMEMLVAESNRNEEMLLDVPFSAEEISAALGGCRTGKQQGLMVNI